VNCIVADTGMDVAVVPAVAGEPAAGMDKVAVDVTGADRLAVHMSATGESRTRYKLVDEADVIRAHGWGERTARHAPSLHRVLRNRPALLIGPQGGSGERASRGSNSRRG
jgi:hypothetical protein